MQKLKRPVSVILSILMVVSMFVVVPFTASAAGAVAEVNGTQYETLEAAFADAQDGDTITVLADCNGNGIVAPQDKFKTTGLTVDFGGHTYTVDGKLVGSTGTETQAFQLLKGNKITFENGTIYSEKALMLVQNYSDLTLKGMTLTLNNPNYAYAYTLSNNNGNIVIDDTTINANPAGGFAFDVCRYSSYPSVNVTVKGDSVINGDVEVSASGNNAKDGFSLNLESGEMYGKVVVDASAQAAIEATPEKASIVEDDNFKFYVAKIGDNKYETLEAAFAAAVDGDTITVLADSTGNGIKAPQGKFATGLTVDFGGHTYTVDGITVGSTGTETQAFQLLMNNTITFKNGTLTSDKAQMIIQNYSNLTLDNMVIDGTQMAGDGNYALSNNNGNVVIKDTTINAREGCIAFDVCRYASYPSVNVTVTGNSVINGNVEVYASSSDPKNGFSLTLAGGTLNGDIVLDATAKTAMAAAPEKAKVTKDNDFTQAAPAGYKWDANGVLVPVVYVAQIGDNKYETLEAAFAAAKDGDTITVLADSAGNGIKAPQGKFATGLTVDFGGHTYTVDGTTVGSTGTETQAFQLLMNNTITFKNGTLTSDKAQMIIQNYSNLTLDNMVIDGTEMAGDGNYALSNNNGNVVIKDTTITAREGCIAFDVCRYASYPSVNVTVTGDSEINGNVEVYASGSDPKNGFSLTLAGGTLNGDIVLDATAKTAMAAAPEKARVTKDNDFTQAAPAGYKWDANGVLVPVVYVAQIGDNKYETLEAAFAAAKGGDTITVLADSTGNGIIAPQGKFATGLTVDFGGHTYTVDGTTVGSTGTETQAFQLLMNNTITFKNGTLTSDKAQMIIQNYSNLTLDNMVIDGTQMAGDGNYALSNNNGNVVIKDTTITAREGCIAFDVCRYASYPSVNVTVKGDSVINGNVEVYASKSDPKNGFSLTLESGTLNGNIVVDPTAAAAMAATPDKAEVDKATGFTAAAPAGYVWVADATDGGQTLAKAVAQIGTTKYATLEAAFAAAKDGDTITVLADSAGNGIKAPQGKFATGLTVDFGGHTYTVDGTTVGSTGTETQAFQLLMNNTITFKNGTLTSDKAQMIIQNYSNLTLDNMVIDGTQMAGDGNYALSNNNGNVVIKDTTITAREGCIAFDVCRYASYPSVNVTVTGDSEINGNVEVYASSSDPKNGFSLTLAGGTLNGDIVLDQTAENVIANNPEKISVTKATTFNQEAPEGYMWVDTETEGVQAIAKAVAQIGTTKYATLEAAFAAAKDGDTITVLADSAGNGIKAPQGKFATGLTVDFGGHTYTVDGTTVGSTGTETQAFQLLMNNTITFKNGTLTSDKAQMIIQNYSNLTLDNMVIDGTEMAGDGNYALSNNNGNVVIKDTTITAREGCIAFDVCRYASYPSVNVTVTGDSEINGNVEVYASGSDPKNGFSLTLESGTLNGNIVLDATAKAAMAAAPEKAEVTKDNDFAQAAPAGYKWVDNGDGTSTLKEIPKLFVGHNLDLGGDIGVNFYLNPEILNAYTGTKTVKFTCDGEVTTVNVPATPTDYGYKVTLNVVAARMAHKINAVVYVGNTALDQTDSYSVQDYAETVYKNPGAYDNKGKPDELKALAKAMLNYGSEAQTVFTSSLTEHPDRADKKVGTTDYTNVTADAVTAKINGTASNLETVAEQLNAKYYTNSLIYLQNNTLRVYFTPKTYPSAMPNAGAYDGNLSNYYYYTDVAGIAAAELDEQQVFTVGNVTFNYSALNYVVNVLNSGDKMNDAQKDLAKSVFLYNQAANAYFDD